MKKIFTLFFLTTAMLSAMAQGGHTLMKFSGKATIDVSGNTVSTLVSDTVKYSGSDVTLPEMRYGQMVIPSFTIHNATFTMDMSTMRPLLLTDKRRQLSAHRLLAPTPTMITIRLR